ncbi:hypothetical protein OQA88_9287 [Cercophora sp. LCS_1]
MHTTQALLLAGLAGLVPQANCGTRYDAGHLDLLQVLGISRQSPVLTIRSTPEVTDVSARVLTTITMGPVQATTIAPGVTSHKPVTDENSSKSVEASTAGVLQDEPPVPPHPRPAPPPPVNTHGDPIQVSTHINAQQSIPASTAEGLQDEPPVPPHPRPAPPPPVNTPSDSCASTQPAPESSADITGPSAATWMPNIPEETALDGLRGTQAAISIIEAVLPVTSPKPTTAAPVTSPKPAPIRPKLTQSRETAGDTTLYPALPPDETLNRMPPRDVSPIATEETTSPTATPVDSKKNKPTSEATVTVLPVRAKDAASTATIGPREVNLVVGIDDTTSSTVTLAPTLERFPVQPTSLSLLPPNQIPQFHQPQL